MPEHSDWPMSRRDVLLTGSIGGLLAASSRTLGQQTSQRKQRRAPRHAKNVIFLVADGMSIGTLSLGDYFLRQRGATSAWLELANQPGVRTGLCNTSAANGPVTDSAAAATAWSIGEKANNGAISVLPDGRKPTPLLVRAQQAGKAVGVVTTTRVTHATPAAFYANVPKRNREEIIASQMIEHKIDVVLGGGRRYGQPHFDDARAAGYEVVESREALLNSDPTKRIIGLFESGHMPFVLDRKANHPSLPEMSRAALDRLARNTRGFVLQIEAGRVDHAAHANDAASLIADQLEFERTIDVVRTWAQGRDDTLIVVTSDHGNANPGCSFYAESGTAALETLSRVPHSFTHFFDVLDQQTESKPPTREMLAELATQCFALELRSAELDMLFRAIVDRERVDPFGPANSSLAVLGSVLANHTGVSFMSVNHTSDHVPTTAVGPGSEALAPFHDNTDLHHLVINALGLTAAAPR